MLCARISFTGLPIIGFAHHFYAENYHQRYLKAKKSFELVYVKAGGITAELYDTSFRVEPGSLFVLFRHLPISLYPTDGAAQSHCSVQLSMDYEFSLFEEGSDPQEGTGGLLLPFVTPPCTETEQIKRELYSIVSELGVSREERGLSASLAACGILSELDALYRRKLRAEKHTSSLLEYKIKQYVAEHIHQEISLREVADAVGKTPNYLNSVFRETTGTSIHRYVSLEKARLIAELMENKGLSFQMACENVAISDVSYGYRLFKKHMGVTPRGYLAGARHRAK